MFLVFFQEIHSGSQGDERETELIHGQAGDKARQNVAAEVPGKGQEYRQHPAQKLHQSQQSQQLQALTGVLLKPLNDADNHAGQKHGNENIMIPVTPIRRKAGVQEQAEAGHKDAHQVQPEQEFLTAAGMLITPDHTEQEQRVSAPAQPAEPDGRGREIQSDMVQEHKGHGGHFQGERSHNSPPFT